MKLNPHKLGAGLLATSPLLINLGGSRELWWVGVISACLAPFLMAIDSTPPSNEL